MRLDTRFLVDFFAYREGHNLAGPELARNQIKEGGNNRYEELAPRGPA